MSGILLQHYLNQLVLKKNNNNTSYVISFESYFTIFLSGIQAIHLIMLLTSSRLALLYALAIWTFGIIYFCTIIF